MEVPWTLDVLNKHSARRMFLCGFIGTLFEEPERHYTTAKQRQFRGCLKNLEEENKRALCTLLAFGARRKRRGAFKQRQELPRSTAPHCAFTISLKKSLLDTAFHSKTVWWFPHAHSNLSTRTWWMSPSFRYQRLVSQMVFAIRHPEHGRSPVLSRTELIRYFIPNREQVNANLLRTRSGRDKLCNDLSVARQEQFVGYYGRRGHQHGWLSSKARYQPNFY